MFGEGAYLIGQDIVIISLWCSVSCPVATRVARTKGKFQIGHSRDILCRGCPIGVTEHLGSLYIGADALYAARATLMASYLSFLSHA